MNAPFANPLEKSSFKTTSSISYVAPGSIMSARREKCTAQQRMFAEPGVPDILQKKDQGGEFSTSSLLSEGVEEKEDKAPLLKSHSCEEKISTTTSEKTSLRSSQSMPLRRSSSDLQNLQDNTDKLERPQKRSKPQNIPSGILNLPSFEQAVEGETMARCIAEMARHVDTKAKAAEKSRQYTYNLAHGFSLRDPIKYVSGSPGRADSPRSLYYIQSPPPSSHPKPALKRHLDVRRQMSAPVVGKNPPPPKPPRRHRSITTDSPDFLTMSNQESGQTPASRMHQYERLNSDLCGMPAVESSESDGQLEVPPPKRNSTEGYRMQNIKSPRHSTNLKGTTTTESRKLSDQGNSSPQQMRKLSNLNSSAESLNSDNRKLLQSVTTCRPRLLHQFSEPAYKPQSQESIQLPAVAKSRKVSTEERFNPPRSHCTKLQMPKSRSQELMISSPVLQQSFRTLSPSQNASNNKSESQTLSKIPIPKSLALSASHNGEVKEPKSAPVKPLRFNNAAFMFAARETHSAPATPVDIPTKKLSMLPSKIPVSGGFFPPSSKGSYVKQAATPYNKSVDSAESKKCASTGGMDKVKDFPGRSYSLSIPSTSDGHLTTDSKMKANKGIVKKFTPSQNFMSRTNSHYTSLKPCHRSSRSQSMEDIFDSAPQNEKSNPGDTDGGTLKADGTYNTVCKSNSGSGFARYLTQMSKYAGGKTGKADLQDVANRSRASLPNRYKRSESWEGGVKEPLLTDPPQSPKQLSIGGKLWGFTKKSPITTRKYKPNKVGSHSDNSPELSAAASRFGYSGVSKIQPASTKSPAKPQMKNSTKFDGLRRMISRESLEKPVARKRNGSFSKSADYYGVCKACGFIVAVGEEVSIQDKIYHKACFKCVRCEQSLSLKYYLQR
ncbi:uncharacterized protein LOC117302624 [Asterias rubens]|uniref:uncharacterized protein LOC117302624 n=1 Tax=Asterias rubens TaxID=7604 RepID=UPI0014552922|nr:uncharacterized protein LOC117302624 [Asterias rubens]